MEGGHLASVGSEATQQYLKEGANRIGQGYVWLGGNDLEQENSWKWTDGTPWDVEFWNSGEPKTLNLVMIPRKSSITLVYPFSGNR